MIKNVFLKIFGIFMILLVILAKPLSMLLPIDTKRPWVDGFIVNTLRACKKYSMSSWLRRSVFILREPGVVLEYLKMLLNKQKVEYAGICTIPVSYLKQGHRVQTDHEHHRERVSKAKLGQALVSDFGPLTVVDYVGIHDGNHRIAALREAGTESCEIENWVSIK